MTATELFNYNSKNVHMYVSVKYQPNPLFLHCIHWTDRIYFWVILLKQLKEKWTPLNGFCFLILPEDSVYKYISQTYKYKKSP